MSQDRNTAQAPPFATLRRFVKRPTVRERCELCGAALAAVHTHLLEPANRQLRCVCDPCAILFDDQPGGRFRRVSPRVQPLPDFQMSDRQWEALHLPIRLAFFVRSRAAGKVVAVYPSPGGATESLLSLDEWEPLAEQNPVLQELEPDTEALLVNRLGQTPGYYRVSIDRCYELVGLIRTHWRGLSGGTKVWQEVTRFFQGLTSGCS